MKYPHKCACGAQCYKGGDMTIKCSSSTCPHWDGESGNDLTMVDGEVLAVPNEDLGTAMRAAALARWRPAHEQPIRPDASLMRAEVKRRELEKAYGRGVPVEGMKGERQSDARNAGRDLFPTWPDMPEGLKMSLQKSNEEYAALKREFDTLRAPYVNKHPRQGTTMRSCSTCSRSFEIDPAEDHHREINGQQCGACQVTCKPGKCRGCGKIYPSGVAPAFCIPCLEKELKRQQEAVKVFRWAYREAKKPIIEKLARTVAKVRGAAFELLDLINRRFNTRQKREEKGKILDALAKLPRSWREGQFAALADAALAKEPVVDMSPTVSELLSGEELETAMEAREIDAGSVSDETVIDLQGKVVGVEAWLLKTIEDMNPATMCALACRLRTDS